MAAILKIEKLRYLQNHLADFDEICMAMHISRFNPIGTTNLKIQDCGLRPFKKK